MNKPTVGLQGTAVNCQRGVGNGTTVREITQQASQPLSQTNLVKTTASSDFAALQPFRAISQLLYVATVRRRALICGVYDVAAVVLLRHQKPRVFPLVGFLLSAHSTRALPTFDWKRGCTRGVSRRYASKSSRGRLTAGAV